MYYLIAEYSVQLLYFILPPLFRCGNQPKLFYLFSSLIANIYDF